MEYKFKMNYLKTITKRYQSAPRGVKKRILDEFCQVCSYNRKYAIWLLNQSHKNTKFRMSKSRKPPNIKYGAVLISILEHIWQSSGYLWSSRLKAALPVWLPWARTKFNLTPPEFPN